MDSYSLRRSGQQIIPLTVGNKFPISSLIQIISLQNNKIATQQITELLPGLRKFAFALTGTVHDADDLLQATVERLLVKGIPQNVDLEKWAYRVCRNLFIDDYRSTRTRFKNEQLGLQAETAAMDAQQIVADQIQLQQITTAMGNLPEDQRTTLALVVLNGFSYSQVAEALDMPIGTVMSRIARARKSLAEELRNET